MNSRTLVLDDTAIDQLKRHVAQRLPAMRPSHRMEFAARGLGYRTYALRAFRPRAWRHADAG